MPTTPDPHAPEREHWRNVARVRPVDIVTPGPGQESVWDYPRPPKVEPVSQVVKVELGGVVIAETRRALRVCETSSPPVYYVPPEDILPGTLAPSDRTSFCEWKGEARYWTVSAGGRTAKDGAWSYPSPYPGFESIRDWLAFYPRRMDACWVGGDRVEPQPGFYYGGWITPNLVGPFKGVPGSDSW